jgi:nicotinamide riboside transporter PnuC
VTLESLTFLLAIVGYAGLTATAVAAAYDRMRPAFWRATVAVIVIHVSLVWTVRYEWQFSEATRNGYAGFLLFHSALLAIAASLLLRARVARWLIWAAFFVVSAGAVGAVFRYDVVARYRIPVMLLAFAGVAGLAWSYVARRSADRDGAARAAGRVT